MSSWPAKDAEEILEYEIDWTDRLDGDTISSSVFTIVSGSVIQDSSTFSNTATIIWLSGGVTGELCEVHNHIVTVAGREFEKTMRIRIRAK